MRKIKPCEAVACSKLSKHGERYCSMHISRLWRNGTLKIKVKKTLLERFMEKVKKTQGCWIWTAALSDRGYGIFFYDGKCRQAHRLSYQLFKTEIPSGMIVIHSCDKPICVNPDHLSVGTARDNSLDIAKKGRAGFQKFPGKYIRNNKGAFI